MVFNSPGNSAQSLVLSILGIDFSKDSDSVSLFQTIGKTIVKIMNNTVNKVPNNLQAFLLILYIFIFNIF